MFRKIDHIGHVVNNFEEAVDLYKNKFGLTLKRTMDFKEFGSKMAFFQLGDIQIEVIKPGGRGLDPAASCLKTRGEGVFHFSILVDDFDGEIKSWEKKGFTVQRYYHADKGRKVSLAFIGPEETKGLWIEIIKAEDENSSGDSNTT